jgi:hypothetical protein
METEKEIPKERILRIKAVPTPRSITLNIQAQSHLLKAKAQEQDQPKAAQASRQKVLQRNRVEQGPKMQRRPDPAQLEARYATAGLRITAKAPRRSRTGVNPVVGIQRANKPRSRNIIGSLSRDTIGHRKRQMTRLIESLGAVSVVKMFLENSFGFLFANYGAGHGGTDRQPYVECT